MNARELYDLLTESLNSDAEYHVRTVSGDLHTGRIMNKRPESTVAVMDIENSGPVYSGTHFVYLAVEHIESIEVKT